MKTSAVAVAACLSAAFLLAGCKDDNKTNSNTKDGANIARSYESPKYQLKDDRFLTFSFDITTPDGRDLTVEALGYCKSYDDEPMAEYKSQCGAEIGDRLKTIAKVYRCFEGSIPAIGNEAREHSGLKDETGYCREKFPPNMAKFTEDGMRRTLEMPMMDNDYLNTLYTVTKITPH